MFFGTVEKPPRLSEFELEVPEELVADHPSKRRDGCKLMVLDTKEETIHHKKFSNIEAEIKEISKTIHEYESLIMSNNDNLVEIEKIVHLLRLKYFYYENYLQICGKPWLNQLGKYELVIN